MSSSACLPFYFWEVRRSLLGAIGKSMASGVGATNCTPRKGAVASRRALDDFRDGHLRLYTLGGENEKAKYTGTNDGPFEIWVPHFYPSLGRAHRYSTEQFIEFYNRKMRYMQTHPSEFPRERREVQQPGAANGSQPIRSETNRTSSAAGSRR